MDMRLISIQFILKSFFIVCFLCFYSTIAFGSHGWGADITYKHLVGNDYEISLTIYHDCYSTSPFNPSVSVSSLSCGNSFNVQMVLESINEITSLCTSLLPNSACNGGNLIGVEESIFTSIVTLPNQCSDWKFSYSLCCRSNLITNSQTPQNYNIYIESTLNNVNGSNDSPALLFSPVFYACVGLPISFTPGATDKEGDSLVYQLIAPLHDASSSIPYLNPFSASYPFSTAPPNSFGFDPSTGMMSFTPATAQAGFINVLIEEYRNGQMIGSVMRDFLIIVLNPGSTNSSVQITPPITISGGTLIGNTIHTCEGETLSFSILGSDVDLNDTLIVSSNIATIPGASLTVGGTTNPIILNFDWPIPPSINGIFPLAITISDNACPIVSEASILFDILIPRIDVELSDSTICKGTTQSIQLNTTLLANNGNGSYQWSPTTGLNNPTIANPIATVSAPITYTVTYTEGACSTSDEINIVYDGILTVNPSSDTICNGNSTQLNASYFENSINPCGLSNAGCINAAVTNQVGTDMTSSGPSTTSNEAGSPFLGYFHDGRWQAIYKASELNANGVTAGLITEIALDISFLYSSIPYSNFTVSLACTQDSFDLSNPNFIGNTSIVHSSSFSPVLGWNTIVFSDHYYWNGSDDLVVQICFDNSSFSNYDHVFYSETSESSVLYTRVDFSSGCILSSGTASLTNRRPNMRFTSCDASLHQYSWAPSNGLSSPSIPNPVASPTTTTIYTVTINNGNCVLQDSVTVIVSQDITLSLNSTQPGCLLSNGSIAVTVNGGVAPYHYSWSDPTIGNNPTATGLSGGIYTITVTDDEGCTVIETRTLSSAQSTSPTGLVISNPTACAGDTIGLTAVGGTPGGGGVLVYYEGSCGGTLINDPNQVIVGNSSNYFVRYEDSCGVTSCASAGLNCFAGYQLEVSVFLEGPFENSSSLMSDDLRVGGLLPYSEPFTGLGFQHLNGGGNESTVASVFSVTGADAIVDWVFVELREGSDDTTPFATRSALLQADGDIVDMDGVSGIEFTGTTVTSGNYWVVIRHRSHLRVMSAGLVLVDGITPGMYDFNTQGAYGNGLKTLSNGDKVLFEGDLNQDGVINSADRSLLWNARNQTGYLVEDSSLDGFCMANDRSQNWNNKNVATQVP